MSHTLDGIALPAAMIWTDEIWSPAVVESEPSITGATLIDAGVRLSGRPITLEASDDGGWIDRSVLLSLLTRAGDAGQIYTFVHADGRAFQVVVADVSARQALEVEDPSADWKYIATIRMIEV
ncbi:MAG: hypothetical protein KDH20_22360 [Rhodocyclaceae bacterium]|nr:hypothetical protein [Rhodocyclaceae bacterium]